MDEQAAISLLQSLGYAVSGPKVTHPVFVCPEGHAHRTEKSRAECIRLLPNRLSRAEYAGRMRERSKPRYIAAYKDFLSGMRKCDIARKLGLSPSRAAQIIHHGFRYARKEGWATVEP